MTGSDEADDPGDDVDAEEDLDELAPVVSSLRTAQEQDGGADQIVERGDDHAESDRDALDELAPVASGVRTAQSQPDAGAADGSSDDGDEGCGGDD
ncbi:hypothetical protein [Natrinema halophilum]|uniref:Uncharacterized protein n=1 Tax=Natrinema halophilum TaxID=1699371 RepID=A0A7D5KYF3_9EURY|nr:hypothetical protein [Natrinema halophilum]QLG50662.1 hypothetical protein HYG82_18385 [Natrinema halophilum]